MREYRAKDVKQEKSNVKHVKPSYTNTDSDTDSDTDKEVESEATTSPFQIPTDEDISESSIPKVKEYLSGLADLLFKEAIFPDAPKFKNTVLKAGDNPRAILHVLIRCYLKKTFAAPGPWAYCEKILQTENANFNEREYGKAESRSN